MCGRVFDSNSIDLIDNDVTADQLVGFFGGKKSRVSSPWFMLFADLRECLLVSCANIIDVSRVACLLTAETTALFEHFDRESV